MQVVIGSLMEGSGHFDGKCDVKLCMYENMYDDLESLKVL